jgi:shikimate dehydrogenase
MAEKTGAVNTIVNNKGRLKGYNTDGYGAVWALMDKTEISNKTVLIVGAGGAARAVAFGLCQHPDTKIFITNRTEINGQILARELGAKFVSMEKLDTIEFDILVNTTPVGMFPYTDEMPVDQSLLRPELVVMDIVYNPLETKLLYTAKTRGCKVIDGVGMFVYQGARQFALWTAMEPPVDRMRQAVYDILSKP